MLGYTELGNYAGKNREILNSFMNCAHMTKIMKFNQTHKTKPNLIAKEIYSSRLLNFGGVNLSTLIYSTSMFLAKVTPKFDYQALACRCQE
mgnify:CR=1 FL=1